MSDVWSGGIAFSYFPAQSAQGEFGMVNISADGKSVTTSDDFDRLKTQYGLVTPPNTPASSGVAASVYPSCPASNSSFVSITQLPPTPNDAACNCLFSTLGCRFTPATSNYTAVVGSLLDTACSLLGAKGGSCTDIGSQAANATYGRLSTCDPSMSYSH